jgi:hypothetical protein
VRIKWSLLVLKHILWIRKNGSLSEFKFGNQFRSDKLISKFQLANEVLIDQPENYKMMLFIMLMTYS